MNAQRRVVFRSMWLIAMLSLCGSQTGRAEEAAKGAASPATAPAAPPPAAAETAVLDGELPAGATTTGTWLWEAQAASGTKSHSHPSAKGSQSHSVTLPVPLAIPKNGEIVTSVWLDPADPPRGLMLKFTLDTGEETGVYWEGEEEVFNPGEDEEIWYYGLLPEYGAWTPLSVVAEDLGVEEAKIAKITFTTYDGRVLWGRTVVRQAAAPPDYPAGDEGDQAVPTS